MPYILVVSVFKRPVFFMRHHFRPEGSNPKKNAYFWTLSKRGDGFQPESKSFGVVFWPSFGHYRGRGGGVEPIPKVVG